MAIALRKKKRKRSPLVRGRHTLPVPFDDPSARKAGDPPDTEAQTKQRAKEHKAWMQRCADHAKSVVEAVKLRPGIEARSMNRAYLQLCEEIPAFRKQMRDLPAIQEERHVKAQEIAELLDKAVWTAEETMNLMFDDRTPFSSRQVSKGRDRLAYIKLPNGEVGRVVLSEAPKPNRKRDPDASSEKSHASAGIESLQPVLLPFPLKTPAQVAVRADGLIEHKKYHMPDADESGRYTFEGCAFGAEETLHEVLQQAEKDNNLLPLKRGREYDEESDYEGEQRNPLTQRQRMQVPPSYPLSHPISFLSPIPPLPSLHAPPLPPRLTSPPSRPTSPVRNVVLPAAAVAVVAAVVAVVAVGYR